MRCRGLQRFANTAYLEGFPFPGLLSVAPYRAPGGIRVVSMSPSYRPSTKSSLRFSSVVAQGAATKRRAPAASPLLPPLPDRHPTRPIQAPTSSLKAAEDWFVWEGTI